MIVCMFVMNNDKQKKKIKFRRKKKERTSEKDRS